jgi:type III secretion system-like peptide-binding chaperone
MALFSNKQEANLRVCIQMVEDAIAALGHVPDESRIEGPDDLPAWKVVKGSAHVFVYLGVSGDDNVLRVVAPVLEMAPGTDELSLFRHLLELNVTEISGAAFGLRNKRDVVLCAERTTVDLDPSEVTDVIRRVEDFADRYDDILVAKFGGRPAGPSSMPID